MIAEINSIQAAEPLYKEIEERKTDRKKLAEPQKKTNFAETLWCNLKKSLSYIGHFRRIASNTPGFRPYEKALRDLGLVTTGIGFVVQGEGLKNEIQTLQNLNEIGDQEGSNLSKTKIASKGIGLFASTLSLAGFILESDKWNKIPTTLFKGAGFALSAAGTLIGASVSIYRTSQLISFRNKLLTPKMNTRVETVRRRIEMLHKMVHISPAERQKIESAIEIQSPHLSQIEKQILHSQACKDAAAVKFNAMKRVTSKKTVELIENRLGVLLTNLNDPLKHDQALKESDRLIQAVSLTNAKKTAYFVASAATSVLALIALIGAAIYAGTVAWVVVPIIITAISTTVTVVDWIAKRYLDWTARRFPKFSSCF